jgi:acrylyl-CoA reductase (NADPH)
LNASVLDRMTRTVGLKDAVGAAQDIVAGAIRGRVIVDVNG